MKNPCPAAPRIRICPPACLLAAVVFHSLLSPARADESLSPPVLQLSSGLPGQQARLSWTSEAGVRYRIERSASLNGEWKQIALFEAAGTSSTWLDPEATKQKAFYRVMQPQTEVFAISPALLQPMGGDILIHGQRIPAGSFLVLDVGDGNAPIFVPLVALGGGVWQASVIGVTLPGGAVISARIEDGNGVSIVTLNEPILVTDTGRADDGPPSTPPALAARDNFQLGRLAVEDFVSASLAGSGPDRDCDDADDTALMAIWGTKKGYDYYQAQSALRTAAAGSGNYKLCYTVNGTDWTSRGGPDEDCDDADPVTGSELLIAFLSKKGYDYYQAQSALKSSGPQTNPFYVENQNSGQMPEFHRPAPSGLPGEVSFQTCDLALPCPAGPPLAWVCTYRSMKPVSSGHGPGWDFSYNIFIEPVIGTDGVSITSVIVHDGGGRADAFRLQADGSYVCDGMFRSGAFSGNTFTLTFADKSAWAFKPLDGSPQAGRVATISDRNGVTLTCDYDAATGLLSTVNDSFGRRITVEWDTLSPPRIASVSAGNGGAVYVKTSYAYTGTDRQLSSTSAPFVPGSPPVAGDTIYTYASGSTDPRLNDNLLSVTDGAGRLLEAFGYATETDPLHLDYDTCVSHDRHKTGHVTLMKREASPPASSPVSTYTMSERDEIGRLTESDFDSHHRLVAIREYTGYCPPGEPVSFTPDAITKTRGTDPDYFETTFTYNADSLCTRVTYPDGSQERIVFDRDFRSACPVRERGNPRLITLRTSAGEERTVSLDHLPGFGITESALPGNPIGGLTIKAGQNPKPKGRIGVWSPRSNYLDNDDDDDNIPTADGRKGWDGTVKGIAAKEEGGRHTPFQNPYRPQFAEKERGITINTSHVEYGTASIGDGVDDDCDGGVDDDCDGFVTRMVSAHGQVSTWGYDETGNLTSYVSALPNRGHLYQYNELGQRVSVTTLNGPTSSFHDEFTYGADGFLSSIVRDSAGLQLTTSFERDANGRVTRVVDPRGNDWLFTYNPLDQRVQVQSPEFAGDAAGSPPYRISTSLTYDFGRRVARCDVEHRSPDGSLVGANEDPVVVSTQAYSTFHVYDDRAHLVRVAVEERPVDGSTTLDPETLGIENFAVCDITRDDAGQIVRLSTPAACRGQSVDRDCDFQYDERGMPYRRIDGGIANPAAVTTEYDYDVCGALVRCATVNSGETSPATLIEYDGFHRLASTTDPMGNVTTFEYGNDGSVTTSVYGQTTDTTGGTGNVLLSRIEIVASKPGYTTRRRVEVLKSNKQGDPDANRHDFGSAGLSLWNGGAFFAVEVEDDTITKERFNPGDTGEHATEITVVDRSPAGLVQSVTRNDDLLYSCSHDTAGRCSGSSNGAVTVSFALDESGHVTESSERYDFRNGPPSTQTFTRSFAYDALGRLTQASDGIGNTVSRAYDSLGRCVSMTESGGRVVRAEYDGASPTTGPFSRRVLADLDADGLDDLVYASLARSGECHSMTDANESTTTFTRDALGRVTLCNHPDGTSEQWGFDALGRNTTRTFQDASVCTSSHDLNGRVTGCSWPSVAAVPDTTYQHDGLGRCVGATQGGSVLVFTYDSLGNQTSETSNGATVARSFNHRGRTGITYPDGRVFSESRDEFGNLLSVSKVVGGLAVSPPVVTMEYLGGRVSQSTKANGVVTSHAYRADGEAPLPGEPDASFDACVRVTVRDSFSNMLTDTVLRRDANQRVTREETAFSSATSAPGRTKSLTRDAAGRVTACAISRRATAGGPELPESSVSYVLGKDGKRISEVRNSAAGTYTRNDLTPPGDFQMGQYTTWPGSTDPIEWDDNGDLGLLPTPTTKIAFARNVAGRVTAVSDATDPVTPVTLVSYEYDALGRCVSRSTGGNDGLPADITSFVYDGSVCIQELGDDGNGVVNAAVTLVCGDGMRHCISTRNGTLYYPHGGGADGDADVYPILPVMPNVLKEIEIDEDITMEVGRVYSLTNSSGVVVERFDYDEARKPIFLTAAGEPSSTGRAVGPIRWMAPESMWEPDYNMFLVSTGEIYSPDLGMVVSGEKDKPKEKKHVKTGHITLMK